jgi:hypothetical protein
MYHTETPTDKTIHEWYMEFQHNGCLCTANWTGRLGPSAETVEQVREMFVRCSICHQGWTYQAPVRKDRNLQCLSLYWHAPLRRDHPGYCTTGVGNPRGTYKLPCNNFILPVG